MTHQTFRDTLQRIETGPSGPQIGAFFDLDGTLVSGYTAAAFYGDRLRRGDIGVTELARTASLTVDSLLGGDTGRLGDLGVESLRGETEDKLSELGERLFAQKIGSRIRPQARELVRAHQEKGHTVAVASSATHFQVDPVAEDLGIGHVLCSELESEEGLLTGRFAGSMLWGEAKAAATRSFARREGVDLGHSHAYGNGVEDAAFLSSVAFPHPTNPAPGLQRIAALQGWEVLDLAEPPRRGLRAAAQTLAAIGGLNVGLLTGLGIGVLRRDPDLGADLGLSFGFQSYLALAGVSLDVIGEAHLFETRPCVFVMNHQSALDLLIVGALTQRRLSALAKKEARYLPPTYLLGRAMHSVWVDRDDPESGRAGQAELVERLRGGYSVVIAPEGTRRPTPVLGQFRTGAFYIALEAGVPVVPIVLRDSFDLMPGSARTSVPGRVHVAVLPPISTAEWSKAGMRGHVAHIRDLYTQTLARWPASPP